MTIWEDSINEYLTTYDALRKEGLQSIREAYITASSIDKLPLHDQPYYPNTLDAQMYLLNTIGTLSKILNSLTPKINSQYTNLFERARSDIQHELDLYNLRLNTIKTLYGGIIQLDGRVMNATAKELQELFSKYQEIFIIIQRFYDQFQNIWHKSTALYFLKELEKLMDFVYLNTVTLLQLIQF